MKKILLDKKIDIEEVITKIESYLQDNELTLIIPKNSSIKKNDFAKLKKVCDQLNKLIIIESVDEKILELAKENDFRAIHPLFDSKKGLLTDIKIEKNLTINYSDNSLKLDSVDSNFKSEYNNQRYINQLEQNNKYNELEQEKNEELEIKHYNRDKKLSKIFILKPKFWLYSILILILGFTFWKISLYFSRAEIILSFQKTPFEFNDVISGNKNISKIDTSKKMIPVELFKNKQNITLFFRATGKKNVSEKASGEITIYNNYSSNTQTLVANTRFESPNGLIYRLTTNITIPGAEIRDGKIIPSSIKAIVVADEPGEKYNSEPIAKLTIPGFKGSPKYDGFYGELKNGAKGGFIGEKIVPLDTDIEKAKKEMSNKLKSALENSISLKKPEGFVFIGDFKTDILKLIVVSTSTDENGNFALLGEGDSKIFGIRRDDIIKFLIEFYNQNTNKKVNDFEIEYLNFKPDFDNGNIIFNLKAKGNFVQNPNLDELKSKILSKKILEVENIIKNLDELESAKIIIKPSWINILPSNPSKINIILK